MLAEEEIQARPDLHNNMVIEIIFHRSIKDNKINLMLRNCEENML